MSAAYNPPFGAPVSDGIVSLSRLALARSFLGTQDPMKFFLDWRTPRERHTARYDQEGVEILPTRTRRSRHQRAELKADSKPAGKGP
jgi:hypothetical protein